MKESIPLVFCSDVVTPYTVIQACLEQQWLQKQGKVNGRRISMHRTLLEVTYREIIKDITVSYTTRNAILSRKKQGKI